jgi:transcriptional regulator with XRE-family HTH domain
MPAKKKSAKAKGAKTKGAKTKGAKTKGAVATDDKTKGERRAPRSRARGEMTADAVPEVAGEKTESADELQLGPRLRALRESRDWSIQRLAREAGVSPATIFKIEKDRMVPSITVLLKLSRALDYPVAEILDEKQAAPQRRDFAVFRRKDRPRFRFTEFPVTIERLVGGLSDRQLEAGIYVVDKGGTSLRDSLTHPGEKIYFVVSGKVKVDLDGQTHVLEEGDAVHLKGSVPHRWENAADGPSRMMFVMTPPLSR